MGFLKGLFIEDEGGNGNVDTVSKYYNVTTPNKENYTMPVTEEVAAVDTSDLLSIEEVYSANGLDNKEKSIYKVNEIKAALPDMPSDAKKASVVGMLTVSKIGVSEIEDDSKLRTDAIIGSLDLFAKETEGIISDAESLIKEKELEIEELKSKIADRKQLQEKQSKLFEDELDLIKYTVEFIV